MKNRKEKNDANLSELSEEKKIKELEKADKDAQKANKTKVKISGRGVWVIATSAACLLIMFGGVYMVSKLGGNKSSGNVYAPPLINLSSSSKQSQKSNSSSAGNSISNSSVKVQASSQEIKPVNDPVSDTASVPSVIAWASTGNAQITHPPVSVTSLPDLSAPMPASSAPKPASSENNTHVPTVETSKPVQSSKPVSSSKPAQSVKPNSSSNNTGSKKNPFEGLPFIKFGTEESETELISSQWESYGFNGQDRLQ